MGNVFKPLLDLLKPVTNFAGPMVKPAMKVAGMAAGAATGGMGPLAVGLAVQEAIHPTGLLDDLMQLGRDLSPVPFTTGHAAPPADKPAPGVGSAAPEEDCGCPDKIKLNVGATAAQIAAQKKKAAQLAAQRRWALAHHTHAQSVPPSQWMQQQQYDPSQWAQQWGGYPAPPPQWAPTQWPPSQWAQAQSWSPDQWQQYAPQQDDGSYAPAGDNSDPNAPLDPNDPAVQAFLASGVEEEGSYSFVGAAAPEGPPPGQTPDVGEWVETGAFDGGYGTLNRDSEVYPQSNDSGQSLGKMLAGTGVQIVRSGQGLGGGTMKQWVQIRGGGLDGWVWADVVTRDSRQGATPGARQGAPSARRWSWRRRSAPAPQGATVAPLDPSSVHRGLRPAARVLSSFQGTIPTRIASLQQQLAVTKQQGTDRDKIFRMQRQIDNLKAQQDTAAKVAALLAGNDPKAPAVSTALLAAAQQGDLASTFQTFAATLAQAVSQPSPWGTAQPPTPAVQAAKNAAREVVEIVQQQSASAEAPPMPEMSDDDAPDESYADVDMGEMMGGYGSGFDVDGSSESFGAELLASGVADDYEALAGSTAEVPFSDISGAGGACAIEEKALLDEPCIPCGH